MRSLELLWNWGPLLLAYKWFLLWSTSKANHQSKICFRVCTYSIEFIFLQKVDITYCFRLITSFRCLMPCPSAISKMFWAGPNILCKTKDWIAFNATPKNFVLALKVNLLNTNHLLVWHKKFGMGTISKKILVWHKKFGPAQTILGHVAVEGQGMTFVKTWICLLSIFYFAYFQFKIC